MKAVIEISVCTVNEQCCVWNLHYAGFMSAKALAIYNSCLSEDLNARWAIQWSHRVLNEAKFTAAFAPRPKWPNYVDKANWGQKNKETVMSKK